MILLFFILLPLFYIITKTPHMAKEIEYDRISKSMNGTIALSMSLVEGMMMDDRLSSPHT